MAQVKSLFSRTVAKKNTRAYGTGESGVDWKYVGRGMVDMMRELQALYAEGELCVMPAPVLEFFHQTLKHGDVRLYSAAAACLIPAHDMCADMLKAWVSDASVDAGEKRRMLEELGRICHGDAYGHHAIYPLVDLYMQLAAMVLTPQENLAALETLPHRGYASERVLLKRVELLRTLGRESEAAELIRQNIGCASLLDAELRHLFAEGRYAAALELVNTALERERKRTGYLTSHKLALLKQLGDSTGITQMCRHDVESGFSDIETYRELKAHVVAEEWPQVYDWLVSELQKQNAPMLLAAIHAAENDTPALHKLLCTRGSAQLQLIISYLPTMPAAYHPGLLQGALGCLKDMAHQAAGRKEYAVFAQWVHRFSLLPGAKPLADELQHYVRSKYPRRTALLDELKEI